MVKFIVLYRDADDLYPVNPPLIFHCDADDADHAGEQCGDANPQCRIAWVYEGSDWHKAFDDYFSTANPVSEGEW